MANSLSPFWPGHITEALMCQRAAPRTTIQWLTFDSNRGCWEITRGLTHNARCGGTPTKSNPEHKRPESIACPVWRGIDTTPGNERMLRLEIVIEQRDIGIEAGGQAPFLRLQSEHAGHMGGNQAERLFER